MYNVSALLLRYANYDDVQSLFALINESNYQIIILWDVMVSYKHKSGGNNRFSTE